MHYKLLMINDDDGDNNRAICKQLTEKYQRHHIQLQCYAFSAMLVKSMCTSSYVKLCNKKQKIIILIILIIII